MKNLVLGFGLILATLAGNASALDFTGDVDGNGYQDRVTFNPYNGQWTAYMYSHMGSSRVPVLLTTWSTAVPWQFLNVADFDGDGRADLIGFDPRTGSGHWWVTSNIYGGLSTRIWGVQAAQYLYNVQIVDVNYDGYNDVYFQISDGSRWAQISTGSGFVLQRY